jgi:hypothetical protein
MSRVNLRYDSVQIRGNFLCENKAKHITNALVENIGHCAVVTQYRVTAVQN